MKPLTDILTDGARLVCRSMDPSIPFERSLVVESTIKVRHPDREWPHSGLSPRQRKYREATERFIDKQRTMVATFVRPDDESGMSVVLGFASFALEDYVTMLYVKRAFRGYGIGAQLADPAQSQAWSPNECWNRWVEYHRKAAA